MQRRGGLHHGRELPVARQQEKSRDDILVGFPLWAAPAITVLHKKHPTGAAAATDAVAGPGSMFVARDRRDTIKAGRGITTTTLRSTKQRNAKTATGSSILLLCASVRDRDSTVFFFFLLLLFSNPFPQHLPTPIQACIA